VTVFERMAGNRQVPSREGVAIIFIGLSDRRLALTGETPIGYLLIVARKIADLHHIVNPLVSVLRRKI